MIKLVNFDKTNESLWSKISKLKQFAVKKFKTDRIELPYKTKWVKINRVLIILLTGHIQPQLS